MVEPTTAYLLMIHIGLQSAIAIRLMMFNPEGRTHRPWVARFAFLLAGSSAAAAAHNLLTWGQQIAGAYNPWQTMFIAVFLVFVLMARGNLAQFLPR